LAYQVKSVPTTILIDRQGIVRNHVIGHYKDSRNILDGHIKALVHPVPSLPR